MELKQVEYFLTIVDTGSFSTAADELYISQSSLSKQIMSLEKELGFQLFDRSKRKIALTPAGEALLAFARNLNEVYQSMLKEIAPYKTAPALSIVAIPVIAQYGITSYIARFKKTYPDLLLRLEEREAIEILPALSNNQYDLAFLRDNYLDEAQYDSIKVVQDQFLVAFSRQHRFANRKSISLRELSNENFVLFDKGTTVHELAVQACRAAGFEPRIFYASLRVESILGMVASNSGVTFMMQKVFEYHRHPDVVGVHLDETITSNIVLVRPNNKKISASAEAFWEFMKAL
jgi:LysR family transcriptional regulator, transcription activator of glutamate synthase operon